MTEKTVTLTEDQLLDLLTSAAVIGRNESTVRKAATRGEITEALRTRMRNQIVWAGLK